MKKEYVKPEAEFFSLVVEEEITNIISGNPSVEDSEFD